jgi:hypothetical protein
MLPAFLADARRDFVCLVPAAQGVTIDLWLVFHRDLRDQPRLRAVAEHLTATAHAWRARLAGQGAGNSASVRPSSR